MQLPWQGVSFIAGEAEVSRDPHHPFRIVIRQPWLCQPLKYHPINRVSVHIWERGHMLQNIDRIYFYINCLFTPKQ